MNAEAGRCAPRPLRAQPRLSSELMTPSVRLSPNYYSLAPSHRRLRDPAIASWMADTATTALPRSRRRTVVADNPLGSSPPDRKEVLHHRGRNDPAKAGEQPLSSGKEFTPACRELTLVEPWPERPSSGVGCGAAQDGSHSGPDGRSPW